MYHINHQRAVVIWLEELHKDQLQNHPCSRSSLPSFYEHLHWIPGMHRDSTLIHDHKINVIVPYISNNRITSSRWPNNQQTSNTAIGSLLVKQNMRLFTFFKEGHPKRPSCTEHVSCHVLNLPSRFVWFGHDLFLACIIGIPEKEEWSIPTKGRLKYAFFMLNCQNDGFIHQDVLSWQIQCLPPVPPLNLEGSVVSGKRLDYSWRGGKGAGSLSSVPNNQLLLEDKKSTQNYLILSIGDKTLRRYERPRGNRIDASNTLKGQTIALLSKWKRGEKGVILHRMMGGKEETGGENNTPCWDSEKSTGPLLHGRVCGSYEKSKCWIRLWLSYLGITLNGWKVLSANSAREKHKHKYVQKKSTNNASGEERAIGIKVEHEIGKSLNSPAMKVPDRQDWTAESVRSVSVLDDVKQHGTGYKEKAGFVACSASLRHCGRTDFLSIGSVGSSCDGRSTKTFSTKRWKGIEPSISSSTGPLPFERFPLP